MSALLYDSVPVRRLLPGDADAAARLHAATMPDPWDAGAWAGFIAETNVVGHGAYRQGVLLGVVLMRVAAEEAEILTLVVAETARRCGIGARLLAGGLSVAARSGVKTVFLEVSVVNIAARRLYRSAGFVEIGRRCGYYRRPGGPVDAVVMSRGL